MVEIEVPDSMDKAINVFLTDAAGNLLMNKLVQIEGLAENGKIKLDLTGLSKGLYLVTIQTSPKPIRYKLLLE